MIGAYYKGRDWDNELELYFYRSRSYDPLNGRFIQKDPIGLTGDGTAMEEGILLFMAPANGGEGSDIVPRPGMGDLRILERNDTCP